MTDHHLVLGTAIGGTATVELDVEALIGSHLCIQANAGGGKSRTIRKIVELAEGRAQRIVLDVEDEFHTLREISPKMVILGPEGDAPANLANAAALPNFLLETGLDAVIQINQLGLEGRRHFIALFLHALIGAPRHLWHPALVVLDETHRYAPQAGKEASSDAVAALASEGRKRGFTAIFATQRLAKIDKDAIGDVNNWLMGRAGQAPDRDRCADELGLKKNSPEMRGLGKLHPGQFWVIGPALTADPMLVHIGNVRSTHLRSGQRGVPVPPGDKTLKAMMAKLHVEPPAPAAASPAKGTAAIPDAPGDGSTVALLRAELAGEYQRGFGEGEAIGEARGFARAVAVIEKNLAGVHGALEALQDHATAVREWATDTRTDLMTSAPAAAAAPVLAPVAERKTRPDLNPNGPNGGGVGSSPTGGTKLSPEQRVLNALAELAMMKVTTPTREMVAFLCGYSNITSTPFARAMSVLGREGMLTSASGTVSLTDAGRKNAHPVKARTGVELRQHIGQMLGGASGNILLALARIYPNAMTREDLASTVGYTNVTSTPFAQAMARLSGLGFVTYPKPGNVAASEILFIGAR